MPGHRGAVPGPGLRRGPRPGIRHAGRRCQARHPGADRPGLLQGAGTVRRGPRPGHVRGRRGPGRRSRGPGRDRVRPGNQPDGTTLELFNDPLLADAFGTPSPAAKPLLRLVGLLHSGTRRWKAAVIERLPRRGERPGRRAAGRVRPGAARTCRPRLLLDGPLDPVLRHRRAPGLAREERREVRPLQDP